MTPYDPRRWTSHLFDIEGSMVREILGRVTTSVIWSAAVVLLFLHGPAIFQHLSISSTAHLLVGTSLGLLLVFRTNSSYDRFWEGRRLLGMYTNRARDLARQLVAYIDAAPGSEGEKHRDELLRLIGLDYAVMCQTLASAR